MKRKDSVKEYEGGWFGVHDDNDPKQAPKRLFRTKEEAQALDSLLIVANGKKSSQKP